ncbi:27 kDa glycoprotein-like isoform X2 [Wyeomyia smithii]|uniref:27 kDa glycoprotein-like isoform X2 n=1 Tax=Wyeomyia smithii TaxID=174621 RepID=UPI0024681268|nr:27 kDa glycoprotein-like isoform X2 [Wyeomyia smithii]
MSTKLLSLLIVTAFAPQFILGFGTYQFDKKLLTYEVSSIDTSDRIVNYDEIGKAVKDKCVKASDTGAPYEQVKQSTRDLSNCWKELVDVYDFVREVEEAKPTGNFHTVFNKYCRKQNTLLECINTFTNTLDPYLDNEEKRHKGQIVDLFRHLLNFNCDNDGDQMTLFITGKGPECFKEQKDDLIQCVNGTFTRHSLDDNMTTTTVPLVIGPNQYEPI